MPPSTQPHWQPRVYIWDGGWLGLGRSHRIVPPHEHHAIQITIGLDAPIRLRSAEDDWVEHGGAIVRPDERHAFDASGNLVAMLFVDPECHEGRWLASTLRQTVTGIPARRLQECRALIRRIWEDPPQGPAIAGLIAQTVHHLCSGPPPLRTPDERILKALEVIRANETTRLPIDKVAKSLHLSPSRFAHLFTEQVGLPFRRYLLWRKLNRAMTLVRRGNTLSAAAHKCGFSDSAHLTRTFYQMFGIAPTSMIGKSEVYEIPAPFEALVADPTVS